MHGTLTDRVQDLKRTWRILSFSSLQHPLEKKRISRIYGCHHYSEQDSVTGGNCQGGELGWIEHLRLSIGWKCAGLLLGSLRTRFWASIPLQWPRKLELTEVGCGWFHRAATGNASIRVVCARFGCEQDQGGSGQRRSCYLARRLGKQQARSRMLEAFQLHQCWEEALQRHFSAGNAFGSHCIPFTWGWIGKRHWHPPSSAS